MLIHFSIETQLGDFQKFKNPPYSYKVLLYYNIYIYISILQILPGKRCLFLVAHWHIKFANGITLMPPGPPGALPWFTGVPGDLGLLSSHLRCRFGKLEKVSTPLHNMPTKMEKYQPPTKGYCTASWKHLILLAVVLCSPVSMYLPLYTLYCPIWIGPKK